VASAVVLERAGQWFLVRPPSVRPASFATPSLADAEPDDPTASLPAGLLTAIGGLPSESEVQADTEAHAAALTRRSGRTVALAPTAALRTAREVLPSLEASDERRRALATARDALRRALRTPEEILITLAREEERVERAVGREARAAEAFLVVPGSPLSEYAGEWTGVRASLDRHHERLRELVRTHARSVVPNLSAVVGGRTAARLVAAAGGVTPLGRMRAGRIQLLGTRRRPSAERGPRYGIIYRADRMSDVPVARRGAYARSLGAIAAIAVRADATTHRSISKELVARRDRRVEQLRRRHP
jgi:snoRNA binding domain, fibrillarin